jgi:hypothetical protein
MFILYNLSADAKIARKRRVASLEPRFHLGPSADCDRLRNRFYLPKPCTCSLVLHAAQLPIVVSAQCDLEPTYVWMFSPVPITQWEAGCPGEPSYVAILLSTRGNPAAGVPTSAVFSSPLHCTYGKYPFRRLGQGNDQARLLQYNPCERANGTLYSWSAGEGHNN